MNGDAIRMEGEFKEPLNKLVRAEIVADNSTIRGVKITGDFFIYPEDFLEEIERCLKGVKLGEGLKEEAKIRIKALTKGSNAQLVGISPEGIAEAVARAGAKQRQ